MSAWSEWLKYVSVPMGIPVRVDSEIRDGREHVFVELSVTCSKTGKPITVKTSRNVPPMDMMTSEEQRDVIRDLMRCALAHEIDESIRIDGELVFDPHKPSNV